MNNVDITLTENGIKNAWFVTGTGVEFVGQVSAQILADSADKKWNRVEVHELKSTIAGQEAGIYPLTGDTPPIVGGKGGATHTAAIGRRVRFDSTMVAASVDGSDFEIKLEATVKLRLVTITPATPENPNGVISDDITPVTKIVTLTVTPKAANALLATATQRNMEGGLSGMAPCNLPSGYDWATVSQEMGAAAVSGVTGHGLISSSLLHTKSELVTNPKLLEITTCWFNSTHGAITGLYDDEPYPTQLQMLGWTALSPVLNPTVKSNISSTRSNLQLNFGILYSCQFANGTTWRDALIGPPGYFTDQAVFGFQPVVFSTLKSGDNSAELPYNDTDGNVIMLDKLTNHVLALIAALADHHAGEAHTIANNLQPPRTFKEVSPTDARINMMQKAPIVRRGDDAARLTTVYRPEPATDRVMYGKTILVLKAVIE